MAASANPSGNQDGSNHVANPPATNGNSAYSEIMHTVSGLRHNPGISLKWTAEEQSILDDLLVKYDSDPIVDCYAKIAMQLKDKTVRDVAFRHRWMTKKENGKRRKDEHDSFRRSKDKKEKLTGSSAKLSHSSAPSCAIPMIPLNNEDGLPLKAIKGLTGQLFEQNAQAFTQIAANLAHLEVHENTSLFCQARDNILKILSDNARGARWKCQA